MESFGSLCIGSYHLHAGIIWLLPFPFISLWVSFSCPMALATISKIILTSNSDSGNLCLVLNQCNCFQFSPFGVMLALRFSHLTVLRHVSSIPSLLIMKGCHVLSGVFCTSIETAIWFLFLDVWMWYVMFVWLNMVYIGLYMLKHPCILRIKLISSRWMVFLMHCFIWPARIFMRIFESMFIRNMGQYLFLLFLFLFLSSGDTGLIKGVWEGCVCVC